MCSTRLNYKSISEQKAIFCVQKVTVYASFLQRPPIDILVDIWMADEKYPIFSKEHHFCLRRSNTAKRSTTVHSIIGLGKR